MRRTMNIWVVIAACACVLIAFFWGSRALQQNFNDVNSLCEQEKAKLSRLESAQTELETLLQTVETDAFIENEARTVYDYMMPDEIRFEIDNPEALYGPDGVPSP